MADIAANLDQQGFCLVEGVLGDAQVQALRDLLEQADLAWSERDGETYGARNLLGFPLVRATAALPAVSACLLPILGEGFRAVRSLFFDKTPGANWPVAWHQDLSLAVREHHDLPGWGNWSVKGGNPHVQPPAEILARMVTLRLHLDDCPPTMAPCACCRAAIAMGLWRGKPSTPWSGSLPPPSPPGLAMGW